VSHLFTGKEVWGGAELSSFPRNFKDFLFENEVFGYVLALSSSSEYVSLSNSMLKASAWG